VTDIYVGYLATSNNFGRYKIGKMDGDHAWIVFEDTGNVEHPSIKTIIANGVVDYKSPKYSLKLNGLYNTNNYGQVKVIKITNSKEVTVEFVNTGNRVVVQKSAILAGYITDKLAIAMQEQKNSELRAEEKRIIAETRRAEKAAIEESNRLVKEAAKAEREAARAAIKSVQRTLDSKGEVFIGTVHKDLLDMEFKVVDRVDGTSQWVVKYLESGNEYNYSENLIRKKSVGDKKREDYFVLKAKYDKARAAKWYQENREHAIKRACEYQKLNLDRARVNNQNRRARRNGAEGNHTLEETNRLLDEQGHKCNCCGIALTASNKHLDHIYPLALGGTNYIWNLQWLCQFCNNSKSATHPDEWEIYSKSEQFQSVLKAHGQQLQ
jgi:5-methylcytosine-specific restriction endonuclease McrA